MTYDYLPLALLALTAPALADVLTVDTQGGPGTFVGIQGAVLNAAEGDTILIREGNYTDVEIVGKSLTLVAEAGAEVAIATLVTPGISPLTVRDLGPGQTVIVRGVRVYPDVIGVTEPSVWLRDNQGAVLLEDVHAEPFPGWSSLALRIENSAAVILARSSFRSGLCDDVCSGGEVISSAVTAYDSQFIGGEGVDQLIFLPVTPGGSGLTIESGSLFAAGSYFEGGNGGDVQESPCNTPGGSGILLGAGAPTVTVRDVTLVPGQPGAGGSSDPPCTDPNRDPVSVGSGSYTELGGDARSLVISSPVREGELLVETFSGPPGDLVFAAFSGSLAAPAFLPFLAGDFALGSPFAVAFKGQIDASGTLVDPVTIDDLPPGVQAQSLHLQAVHVNGVGAAFTSGPSSTVLLDASL
ncbi:MAG: hypothetical protein AAF682_06385 [Planctomycetota bacterium]